MTLPVQKSSASSLRSFIKKKLEGTEEEIQRLEAKKRKLPHEKSGLAMLKMQRSTFKKILEKERW